jgi:hypothetical protein
MHNLSITYTRGDIIEKYIQRFDSKEIGRVNGLKLGLVGVSNLKMRNKKGNKLK